MTRDDALMKLYEHVRVERTGAPGFTGMSGEEQKAYMAERNREARARQREAIGKGERLPSKANVRTALADAALMLLATDGPGAEQVRRVLSATFPGKPGLLLKIDQQARSGTLCPKLVDPARVAEFTPRLSALPRPEKQPAAAVPTPEPVARREPLGAMSDDEIEAIVPAFLRRGT